MTEKTIHRTKKWILGLLVYVAVTLGTILLILGLIWPKFIKPKVFFERMVNANVEVETDGGFGSATLVQWSNTVIALTAAHVVGTNADNARLLRRVVEKNEYVGSDVSLCKLKYVFGELDVAEMRPYRDSFRNNGVVICPTGANLGETVYVVSSRLGGAYSQSISRGIVSAVGRRRESDKGEFLVDQTDAAVSPGSSGGGVFNDRGEFVGMVVLQSVSDHSITLFISSRSIAPLLR